MTFNRPLFYSLGIAVALFANTRSFSQTAPSVRKDLGKLQEASLQSFSSRDEDETTKDDKLQEQLKTIEILRVYFLEADQDREKVPELRGKPWQEHDRLLKKWIKIAMQAPDAVVERNLNVYSILANYADMKDAAVARFFKKHGILDKDGYTVSKDDPVNPAVKGDLTPKDPLVKDAKWLINRTPSLEKCDAASDKLQQSIDNLDKTSKDTIRKYKDEVIPLMGQLLNAKAITQDEFSSAADASDGKDFPDDSARQVDQILKSLDDQHGLSAAAKDLVVQLSRKRTLIRQMADYQEARTTLIDQQRDLASCRDTIKDRNDALEKASENLTPKTFTTLYEKSTKAYSDVHSHAAALAPVK